MTLSPGDAVRIEMTKWPDRPHWVIPGRWLGQDRQGDWLAFPRGTFMSRPGAAFVSPNDQVGLVPTDGAWLATFHGPGGAVSTYVDMTTAPTWEGSVVRAVDLDLDVVERLDHTVFVDDEDEFDEHRVAYGYPDHVVALATSTRDAVLAAVRDRVAPFDGTAEPWLARVGELRPAQ